MGVPRSRPKARSTGSSLRRFCQRSAAMGFLEPVITLVGPDAALDVAAAGQGEFIDCLENGCGFVHRWLGRRSDRQSRGADAAEAPPPPPQRGEALELLEEIPALLGDIDEAAA